MTGVDLFFSPSSIAVIGATSAKGKPGCVILESMKKAGFPGRIYPVNPRHKEIDGAECFDSIRSVNADIDIAVIAVPAHAVIDALREAAAKGVKCAVIVSSGFGETGVEGKRLEDGIRGMIKDTGIRVIGPNCLGIFDNISRLDTFFVPAERMGRPKNGGISILSQSGSFACLTMDELTAEGIGVARVVSYGNRVDVGESECLSFLAEDPHTKAIAIYMESVDDGRRFIETASLCTSKKPVVAVKVGKRDAGINAARSHTGAMTGRYEIYRAAFRKAGVTEVEGYEGLKDACRTFNIYSPAEGNRVFIITDGGGIGVRVADACEEAGLSVLPLSEDIKKSISSKFPPYYSINNPTDLTGSATDEEYLSALDAGLNGGYDMAIVNVLWGPPRLTEGLVDKLTVAIRSHRKPVLICSPGGEFTRRMNRRFEDNGVPVFTSPESVARAAAVLASKKWK